MFNLFNRTPKLETLLLDAATEGASVAVKGDIKTYRLNGMDLDVNVVTGYINVFYKGSYVVVDRVAKEAALAIVERGL